MEERVERVVRVGVGRHPAEREHVVIESGGADLLEHGGPLEDLHLRLDADLLEHGLDRLGDLAVLGVATAGGQPRQGELLPSLLQDAVGPGRPARLGEEGLGAGAVEGVELVELHVLEAEHAGSEHAAGGHRRALQDVLENGLAVHRVQEGRAHAHVVERGQPGMHAREDHAPAHYLVDDVLGVTLEGGELGGGGQEHHVGVARLERDHPGALFRHHLEDDAIERRLVAPVVGIALEDDVGIGLSLEKRVHFTRQEVCHPKACRRSWPDYAFGR